MNDKSKASELLTKQLQRSLSKNPELAAKQRRLLAKLSASTNSPQPSDSTNSASAAEQRKQPQRDATDSVKPSDVPGPVGAAMRDNPGLTLAEALRHFDAYGG